MIDCDRQKYKNVNLSQIMASFIASQL